MPQLKLLQRVEGMERDVLASRIDELSRAFKEAARNTAVSRVYNTERLRQRAQAGDLQVGDHVVVYASDAGRLEPHWDHGFVVTHVRGPVVKVVGPRNKRLTLNRDKVKLVAPESDWDNLRNRLTRTERAALQRASVPAGKDVNAPSASPRNANQSVGPELRPELNVDNEGHFNNGHAGSDMSDISDSVPEPRGMRRLATDLDPTYRPSKRFRYDEHQPTGPVLRSHVKRRLAPSPQEQLDAKRRCVVQVMAFFGQP